MKWNIVFVGAFVSVLTAQAVAADVDWRSKVTMLEKNSAEIKASVQAQEAKVKTMYWTQVRDSKLKEQIADGNLKAREIDERVRNLKRVGPLFDAAMKMVVAKNSTEESKSACDALSFVKKEIDAVRGSATSMPFAGLVMEMIRQMQAKSKTLDPIAMKKRRNAGFDCFFDGYSFRD